MPRVGLALSTTSCNTRRPL